MGYDEQSLERKRKFIKWFYEGHEMKWQRVSPVLELLMFEDRILSRVVFVDDIRDYPDAILISARGTDTSPFLFRRDGRFIYGISEAIVELKKNPPSRLFVQLSFDREPVCALCRNGFEIQNANESGKEGPDMQPMPPEKQDAILKIELRKGELRLLIDRSLDERDQKSFEAYVKELSELLAQTKV